MNRRNLLRMSLPAAAAALPLSATAAQSAAASEQACPAPETDLKITGVRLVKTRPLRPLPSYEPAADSWSTGGVEVANPMSVYPA